MEPAIGTANCAIFRKDSGANPNGKSVLCHVPEFAGGHPLALKRYRTGRTAGVNSTNDGIAIILSSLNEDYEDLVLDAVPA